LGADAIGYGKLRETAEALLMIIDLSQIQEEPKTYHLHLPQEWWEPDVPKDQVQGLYEPVVARLTIEKIGRRFMVSGTITTVLMLQCDRCLELYGKQLKGKFQLFLEPMVESMDSEEDIELAEDQMGIDLLPKYQVDLERIIKEQIYLSLPMKTLCKEDCLGLCPVCGADLNKQKCSCYLSKGHPAFMELKKLL